MTFNFKTEPNRTLNTLIYFPWCAPPDLTQNPKHKQHHSSVSSHLAMVELKQNISTSLSKLSDRDAHQIAIEDLEKTIWTRNLIF